MINLGVLGGGQLGQMLMQAAQPLGIQAICFDNKADIPAAMSGPIVVADVDDTERIRAWAHDMNVLTYEFENFPTELVAHIAEIRPVHPSPIALAAAQDRYHEKRLFAELDIPIPPFRLVSSIEDIAAAFEDLGPLLVKTRTGGYDGKGQARVQDEHDIERAAQLLSVGELIAETLVAFDTEISVIGVRGTDGSVRVYPLTENEHRNGILHASIVPAAVDPEIQETATAYIMQLLGRLEYVGVLTLELFVTNDGRVLANEIAPRVHNSGHWTIEGAETSQFENHVRAVCGLPLGSTRLREPSAMVNLVGVFPKSAEILAVDGAHLHDYTKSARPGRKLGHVTLTAPDMESLQQRLAAIERLVDNDLG